MEDRVTWWRGDMRRTGGRVIGFAARRYLKPGSGAQSADLISGGDVWGHSPRDRPRVNGAARLSGRAGKRSLLPRRRALLSPRGGPVILQEDCVPGTDCGTDPS